MTFLNPILAGVALGCVVIPIIIHILMRRRRRPVPWGAMRFLMLAYRKQRRRMNLEQLLLLGARCLLVALLALAVAKPILGGTGLMGVGGSRTVYLLIDNSLTAGASGRDGPALETHKRLAKDIISKLDRARGDRVGVILLAAPADGAVMPATAEISSASDLVRDLRAQDSRADLPGAMAKLRDELNKSNSGESVANTWVVVLSEFRVGSADTEAVVASLGLPSGRVSFMAEAPATEGVGNVSITSVEPDRGVLVAGGAAVGTEGSMGVRVTLRRSGATPGAGSTTVEVTASYGADDSTATKAEARAEWGAGQDSTRAFVVIAAPVATSRVAPGSPVLLTATIGPDAIEADNRFVRPVETRDRLEVAIVAPGPLGVRGNVAEYTPADWLAIALSPQADLTLRRRQSGELRVNVVDPTQGVAPGAGGDKGARGAGALKGMDAILLPRPDLLDAGAWRAVREQVDSGALVLITPPTQVEANLWTDEAISALGVPWQIGREARALPKPAGVVATTSAVGGAGGELLGMIAAELKFLASGVSISKMLEVRSSGGPLESILTLEDGTPLLVAASAANAEKSGADASSRNITPRGTVMYMASAPDLSWCDLPTRPFMVPLIQEIVRQGVGKSVGSRATPAGTSPSLPAGASELVKVEKGNEGARAGVPITAAGTIGTPIRSAGVWVARAAGGVTLGEIAFNPDGAAAATDPRSRDEVAKWLSQAAPAVSWLETGSKAGEASDPISGAIGRRKNAPPISVPLLIAAGIIAVVELTLARIFSHAGRDETYGAPAGEASAS